MPIVESQKGAAGIVRVYNLSAQNLACELLPASADLDTPSVRYPSSVTCTMSASILSERTFADRYVFDVGIEVEAPRSALTSDAGIATSAKRRGKVANEEAVHPDRSGNNLTSDPQGARFVAREQSPRESVFCIVGERDRLLRPTRKSAR